MTENQASTILEDIYRRQFDEPTESALQQLKFALRIFQWAGYKAADSVPFLLMLESILEKGDQEESVRTKLLRLLQPDEPGSSNVQVEERQEYHHPDRPRQHQTQISDAAYAGMLEEAERWGKLFDLAKRSRDADELSKLVEQEYPEALKPGGILSQDEAPKTEEVSGEEQG